jgi:protein translocase SecG subunit
MNLLEVSWFLVAFLLIVIVLLTDPKSSLTGSATNPLLGAFSSPSSGQKFFYQFSGTLLGVFLLLTVLNYNI